MHLTTALLAILFAVSSAQYYDWRQQMNHVEPFEPDQLEPAEMDNINLINAGLLEPELRKLQKEKERRLDSLIFPRERRGRLCGGKLIEMMKKVCNNCLVPEGNELVAMNSKRSIGRIWKRSAATLTEKCCFNQCPLTEIHKMCCPETRPKG